MLKEELLIKNCFWIVGISLVDESQVYAEADAPSDVVLGLQRAYVGPQETEAVQETEQCAEATDQSLEELMNQMKSI